jgi:hypothetical protein
VSGRGVDDDNYGNDNDEKDYNDELNSYLLARFLNRKIPIKCTRTTHINKISNNTNNNNNNNNNNKSSAV